jgi:hypothetical protein
LFAKKKTFFEKLGSGENPEGRHPQDKITTGMVKTSEKVL